MGKPSAFTEGPFCPDGAGCRRRAFQNKLVVIGVVKNLQLPDLEDAVIGALNGR